MSPALRGLSPALPVTVKARRNALLGSDTPEIYASKFTLHILSDQWLKYILLKLCNATRHLGDGLRVILRQRVRGSVRAVRAVGNTQVFLTETRVVADAVVQPQTDKTAATPSPNNIRRAYADSWYRPRTIAHAASDVLTRK